jgi:hypothetical protein
MVRIGCSSGADDYVHVDAGVPQHWTDQLFLVFAVLLDQFAHTAMFIMHRNISLNFSFQCCCTAGSLKGHVMLQNLPSIVAAQVLNPQPGSRVLDMCAGAQHSSTKQYTAWQDVASTYHGDHRPQWQHELLFASLV